MADGAWTLPPMAQGRPLAADNGSAPPLPMMQTAHSRDRSGTVGLEGEFCELYLDEVLRVQRNKVRRELTPRRVS